MGPGEEREGNAWVPSQFTCHFIYTAELIGWRGNLSDVSVNTDIHCMWMIGGPSFILSPFAVTLFNIIIKRDENEANVTAHRFVYERDIDPQQLSLPTQAYKEHTS